MAIRLTAPFEFTDDKDLGLEILHEEIDIGGRLRYRRSRTLQRLLKAAAQQAWQPGVCVDETTIGSDDIFGTRGAAVAMRVRLILRAPPGTQIPLVLNVLAVQLAAP